MPSEAVRHVNLGDELETEIGIWLHEQITSTLSARSRLEDLWDEILEFYEMTELDEKKDYPFEGAAHLMIQVVPTLVETMKSRVMGTIFAPQDPFTPKSSRAELQPFLRTYRKFLTWAAENELDLEETLDPVVLELFQLGTVVVKIVYDRQLETIKEWDEDLEEYLERVITRKDHPQIEHIQPHDFIFPLETRGDLDKAPWLDHRFRLSRNDLVRGEESGKYKNIDKIENWTEHTLPEHERKRADREGVPVLLEEYELHEVWFEYPVKEGDPPTKFVGFFHLDSMQFIKLTYNWFPYGLHPFEVAVDEKRPHRVYGNGAGTVGLPFQKEISVMHNQRLDGMTIANAPLFKRKADSLIPEDPVWRAGAMIPVDDMNDIDVLFSGQRYDSTLNEEQHTHQMLKERVGIQEFSIEQLSGTQSTTALAAMGEANRRFDDKVRSFRKFLSRVMLKVMLMYQKYYPDGRTIMIQGPEGQATELVLKFPDEWIIDGMGIDVTATTSSMSRELERQNKLSLFGMLSQVYGQVAQYLVQALQTEPPVQMVMFQIVVAILTFSRDVLDDFNLANSRELTAMLENIQGVAEQLQAQAASGQPPGPPGMGGVPGPPGGGAPGPGQEPQGGGEQGGGV